MIKWLIKKLFRWKKTEFLHLSFEEQLKERVDESLVPAFVVNGRQWYKWANDMLMPVQRFGYWKVALIDMDNKVDQKYLEEWIGLLLDVIKKGDKDLKEDAIYLAKELDARRRAMYNPNAMLRACSIYYIREDQLDKTNVYDEVIEQDKLRELKEAKQGELGNFLLESPLRTVFKSLSISDAELESQIQEVSKAWNLEMDKLAMLRSVTVSEQQTSTQPN